jgi:hypothetical protein
MSPPLRWPTEISLHGVYMVSWIRSKPPLPSTLISHLWMAMPHPQEHLRNPATTAFLNRWFSQRDVWLLTPTCRPFSQPVSKLCHDARSSMGTLADMCWYVLSTEGELKSLERRCAPWLQSLATNLLRLDFAHSHNTFNKDCTVWKETQMSWQHQRNKATNYPKRWFNGPYIGLLFISRIWMDAVWNSESSLNPRADWCSVLVVRWCRLTQPKSRNNLFLPFAGSKLITRISSKRNVSREPGAFTHLWC